MKQSAKKTLGVAIAALPAMLFADEVEVVQAAAAAEEPAAVVQSVEETSAAEAAALEEDTATRLNTLAKTRVRASSRVREDMRKWKKEAKITTGNVTPNGAIYLEGLATVSENAASPEFINARSAAFEQAYLDALTGYVMDKSGATSFKLASSYFNDGSSDRAQPTIKLEDAADRIARKASMLEEAKLDASLREAGVPVVEIQGKTIVEKRQLFLESVLSEAVDCAVDSAAGIAVVKTFEGNDETGQYAVGVILRGGVETEVIAECLRNKRRPVMKKPELAESVDDLLPPVTDIVQEFGVRVIFDENGVPALLSYGQYGSDYTGMDEEEAEDMERLAFELARGQANDLLTTFINSQISIANHRTRGSSRERFLEFDSNGIPTKTSIKNFVSNVTKSTNLSGSDTMIGRSTVFEDVVDHPAGHRVAVCVRMWSFNQYDLMEGIKNRPPATQEPIPQQAIPAPQPAAAIEPPKPRPPKVKRSRTYDF